jgi:hypothetical protein
MQEGNRGVVWQRVVFPKDLARSLAPAFSQFARRVEIRDLVAPVEQHASARRCMKLSSSVSFCRVVFREPSSPEWNTVISQVTVCEVNFSSVELLAICNTLAALVVSKSDQQRRSCQMDCRTNQVW